MKRDWTDARAKVDAEGRCRVCGRSDRKLDAAHTTGREYDEPKTPGSKTLYVDPDDIVPLCGPFPHGCHGADHRHEIDLLGYLSPAEQVKAVKNLKSLEAARRRLWPSAYRFPESPKERAA